MGKDTFRLASYDNLTAKIVLVFLVCTSCLGLALKDYHKTGVHSL